MNKFNIEVLYQPLNNTWSALVKKNDGNFLEVDQNPLIAISKVINLIFPVDYKNPSAVLLGSIKSKIKSASSKENGKKGGRPKKVEELQKES